MPTTNVNVTCLAKGSERYVVLYDDRREAAAVQAIGRWAASPRLSFTWRDATVMTQHIYNQGRTENE